MSQTHSPFSAKTSESFNQARDEISSRKPLLSRRNFLGVALFSSLTVLFGQSIVALLNYLRPQSGGGFGGLVYAGKVEEFAVNSVNHILSGRCYIARLEDGMLAVWQKCTHLGCAVPYDEAAGQFHCPCHGSVFNNVGEVTGGPAPRPLDTFPITIKGGEVWVDTGKPMERSSYDPSQLTGV
jgi:cytochrome b6-f complex iron-sulfur subunit